MREFTNSPARLPYFRPNILEERKTGLGAVPGSNHTSFNTPRKPWERAEKHDLLGAGISYMLCRYIWSKFIPYLNVAFLEG